MKTAADFPTLLSERIQAAGLRVRLTGAEVDRLEKYYRLLAKWNRRINLTSLSLEGFPRRTLDRLFVEPLAGAELIEDSAAVWLDLGSGGGSPALPLKIVRPRLALTMVESRAKKATFLREAARAIELGSVKVLTSRIEELGANVEAASADLVTVRAVKLDRSILDVVSALLRPSGRLFLFGVAAGSDPSADSGRQLRRAVMQNLPSTGGCLAVLAKM